MTRLWMIALSLFAIACSTPDGVTVGNTNQDVSFQGTDADVVDTSSTLQDTVTSEVASDTPQQATCGDGVCAVDESALTCPEDCEALCGDGACSGDETSANCPVDCGAECGDGVCNGDESSAT